MRGRSRISRSKAKATPSLICGLPTPKAAARRSVRPISPTALGAETGRTATGPAPIAGRRATFRRNAKVRTNKVVPTRVGASLIAMRPTKVGEAVRSHAGETAGEGVCSTALSRVPRQSLEKQRPGGGPIASLPLTPIAMQSPVGPALFAVCPTATNGRHGPFMFTTSSERVPPIQRALRRSGTRRAITVDVESYVAIMPGRNSQT